MVILLTADSDLIEVFPSDGLILLLSQLMLLNHQTNFNKSMKRVYSNRVEFMIPSIVPSCPDRNKRKKMYGWKIKTDEN